MPAEYRAKIEESRPRLNAIAREQYGLELNPGPFGINSRPALTAAKWAESQEVGLAYHSRVMDAYWRLGLDISDVQVLREVVGAIGLNADELDAVLADPGWATAVDEDITLARELGLNSVPAMVFAQQFLVSGAQPYEVLCRVVEQIRAGD
jgi:predicted DsbA family dithiol-disulfide isomerase